MQWWKREKNGQRILASDDGIRVKTGNMYTLCSLFYLHSPHYYRLFVARFFFFSSPPVCVRIFPVFR